MSLYYTMNVRVTKLQSDKLSSIQGARVTYAGFLNGRVEFQHRKEKVESPSPFFIFTLQMVSLDVMRMSFLKFG